MRASTFTLILLCALPIQAETTDQLDILRARSNEQERQIRTLENEIETLHGQLALERGVRPLKGIGGVEVAL